MKTTLPLTLLIALATACTSSPKMPDASTPAGHVAPTTLRTIALIMGEPNFAMDGGYQELEEGLYTKPELKPGKKMFAPIQDIVTLLGGEYRFDAATVSATYVLAGHVLTLTAGENAGVLDRHSVATDTTPELRDGSLWVSLPWVFEQLGAYTKWEESRQRFSATLILPVSKKTEDVAHGGPVIERNMSDQSAAFYASAEGRQLADVVVGYQNSDGGWPKLDNDANMLVPINTAHLSGVKGKSTIDNDSTTKQVTILARAYTTFKDPRYLRGFNRGLDYLLAAQLANGGWQQFWPNPIGYKQRITFNDDAVANVLEIMRDIDKRERDYRFVDASRRERATGAFKLGLTMILKTQLIVNERKTGWCAQYDENTLEPAMGRAFELASISGHESVNVVKFLMSLDQPSPDVVQAIQDAVQWFDSARLTGIKRLKKEDRTLEMGFDYVVVKDPAAPPLWARFYDPITGKPLFSSRDSLKRTDFADVSYERRVKYNWFAESPRELLEKDYPAWQRKWAPTRNVLRP